MRSLLFQVILQNSEVTEEGKIVKSTMSTKFQLARGKKKKDFLTVEHCTDFEMKNTEVLKSYWSLILVVPS